MFLPEHDLFLQLKNKIIFLHEKSAFFSNVIKLFSLKTAVRLLFFLHLSCQDTQ